jgi:hypothetical protein
MQRSAGRPRKREARKPGSSKVTVHNPLPPPKAPTPPKPGRPTDYNAETAKAICGRLAEGESLASICKDEAMPARGTVYRWLLDHPEFQDIYDQARLWQGDTFADEVKDEADKAIDKDSAFAARVRMAGRQWAAEKLNPRKYGGFQRQEITGKEGGPLDVRTLSDAELDRRIAQLARKNGVPHPAPGEGMPPVAEQVAGVLPG